MRLSLIAVPLLVLASPAIANPYVELGAGPVDARANDVDQLIDYSSAARTDLFVDDVFGTRSKWGPEVSGAVGTDLGWLRLEAEVAHRRVRTSRIAADDGTAEFLATLNGALERPSATLPALGLADFQRPGHVRSLSLMANAVADWKVAERLTLFLGGGYGMSRVRGFGDADEGRSYHYMLGLRVPVGERLELGLKHRYFDSGKVTLEDKPRAFAGVQTGASVVQRFEGHWRTRSVQMTAGWRF